jgi:predicted Rossmann fold nucleotide-binding protein DprA/Smf involved in DNA uptake
MLIRLGAALIRDSGDILELLNLKSGDTPALFDLEDLTDEEKIFIEILTNPCERDELVRRSKIDISQANAILSLLEIKGLIKEELGEVRKTF